MFLLLDPEFVSSFDVGDYVYFFFREHSLEHANCARVVYSRVARVCKVSQRPYFVYFYLFIMKTYSWCTKKLHEEQAKKLYVKSMRHN